MMPPDHKVDLARERLLGLASRSYASSRGLSHVSPPTVFFFLALFVAAIIAVALIMWFAIPRKKCPGFTQQQKQEACKETMKTMGRGRYSIINVYNFICYLPYRAVAMST